VPHPFPVLGKGAGFDFTYFLLVSRPPEPFNPYLTVQFLIPVMHCYSLHNLILASYSPSCISNAVLAESFRDLRGQRIPRPCRGVSALDWSFSVFPNLQLSTLDLPSFLSPLAATLMDLPASVANKRLTAWLNSLDDTYIKQAGWGVLLSFLVAPPYRYVAPTYLLCLPLLRKPPGVYPEFPFWKGVYSQRSNAHFASRMALRDVQRSTFRPSNDPSRPIAAQGPWCHNWQRCTKFFPIRGNNSAPPGV